jgi:hypothetical protein
MAPAMPFGAIPATPNPELLGAGRAQGRDDSTDRILTSEALVLSSASSSLNCRLYIAEPIETVSAKQFQQLISRSTELCGYYLT